MTNDATLAPAGATEPPRPPRAPAPLHLVAAPSSAPEQLVHLLDQAATVAALLTHNFGGDGSFDEPSDAPGLAGLVDCVTSLLTTANARAAGLGATEAAQKAILHASSLAEHLSASSRDELYGGQRGFRLGDRFLSMCYWTVGQHTQRAIDDLNASEVQA